DPGRGDRHQGAPAAGALDGRRWKTAPEKAGLRSLVRGSPLSSGPGTAALDGAALDGASDDGAIGLALRGAQQTTGTTGDTAVMAILIWGSREKSIDLGPAGNWPCPNCGLQRSFRNVLRYQFNHLYHLLGFVTRKRYLRICEVCGRGQ